MPIGFDPVRIANMALAHVGNSEGIESLTELNSPAAAQCNLWYDAARLQALEAHNWSFARKSLTLSTHDVAAPDKRWAYRYQMPVDCVAARMIENPAGLKADPIPYDMEDAGDGSLSLVTDQYQAVLIYTYNLEAASRFSLSFIDLFAVALAIRIARPLTTKPGLKTSLIKEFKDLAISAPASDAYQAVPHEQQDADWHQARK